LKVMTKALPFTQAHAERAIKAARKLGLKVTGMTIAPGGIIQIQTAEQGETSPAALTGRPKLRDAREKLG
jgi:hypothetical protein